VTTWPILRIDFSRRIGLSRGTLSCREFCAPFVSWLNVVADNGGAARINGNCGINARASDRSRRCRRGEILRRILSLSLSPFFFFFYGFYRARCIRVTRLLLDAIYIRGARSGKVIKMQNLRRPTRGAFLKIMHDVYRLPVRGGSQKYQASVTDDTGAYASLSLVFSLAFPRPSHRAKTLNPRLATLYLAVR